MVQPSKKPSRVRHPRGNRASEIHKPSRADRVATSENCQVQTLCAGERPRRRLSVRAAKVRKQTFACMRRPPEPHSSRTG